MENTNAMNYMISDSLGTCANYEMDKLLDLIEEMHCAKKNKYNLLVMMCRRKDAKPGSIPQAMAFTQEFEVLVDEKRGAPMFTVRMYDYGNIAITDIDLYKVTDLEVRTFGGDGELINYYMHSIEFNLGLYHYQISIPFYCD